MATVCRSPSSRIRMAVCSFPSIVRVVSSARNPSLTEVDLAEQIQPIRGMNDILPGEIGAWQYLERIIRDLVAAYGYEEMRVPIVEQTSLFKRSIGEFTDVVGKEMYSFESQGG